MTTEEKRAHPRFPLVLAVDHAGGAALVWDYTEELAAGGLFVRTTRDFEVGAVVPLVVSFPELLEPVELVTEVIRVRAEGPEGPAGVALWVPPERTHERGKLQALAHAAAEAAKADHPPYRVLLVEDNALVAAMYTSALRRLSSVGGLGGVVIEVAHDGREALDRLFSRPPIDLVITDLFMPLMSGDELVERMRGDSRTEETPVIVISSCGPEERDRITQLGANFFLSKPVKYQDIVATVRALLALPRTPSGSSSSNGA
jgi:CheY-like chemotaxis protein/Tfp pilus assembly protein PilZ